LKKQKRNWFGDQENWHIDPPTPLIPVLKTKAALIALICAVVLAQKDIKYLIATDPVPNAIIPLWAVMAYLIVVFMPASLLHRGWNK
jgi:hypothetical protein